MSSKYKKVSQIDHVLLRPDMYVGNPGVVTQEEYVAIETETGFKIKKKSILYSKALLRLFIEGLSNAIDNVFRSTESVICTKIKVDIDFVSGKTIIWNDGPFIPIEKNIENDCYNHTLIFGHLLSGSNYDDTESRVGSGRNGIGAKAISIFSNSFKVRALDPDHGLTFEQEWNDNMKKCTEPMIKKTKLKKAFTEITWIPDFKRFGMESYSEDLISLYIKYIIDTAMLTKVKVYFNDTLVNVNSLKEYASLYFEEDIQHSLLLKNTTSEVFLCPNQMDSDVISFVNGICTKYGGKHVDSWSETIFRPLLDKLNKKDKPQLTIKDIKQFFKCFIIATVVNPEFDSQEKNKLESPSITSSIKPTTISTIMKWPVIKDIQESVKLKEFASLKKTERKKSGYVKVEGLDPANYAGTKHSSECILIVCEGLSAKTYAICGIEKGVYDKKGRNYFGVLAMRGKLLNVRNSTIATISKNKVINNIIQALGLRYNVDYSSDEAFKTLRYGKLMLLCDADVDGKHIQSLVINFIHFLFPSLLERKFIISMETPIVRIFKKPNDILFYDERKFREYCKKNTKALKLQYYKGLGTCEAKDVPDTFGMKMVEYHLDSLANETIEKVFHKKNTDERKDWLAQYDPENCSFSLDDKDSFCSLSITEFINEEMIKFSYDDCKRSIPSMIDGLKESQRKVLYAVFKKNLKYTGEVMKVAQLGGYVSEITNYHHGEQNLYDTIIKMACDFPGSNNIPLLYRGGMYTTRLNGEDASSARYIFTKMDSLTQFLFRKEDEPLLEHMIDDNDVVEPKFYIPILPLILINRNLGIGTGWSTEIPTYNPKDIINCVKMWIENKGDIFVQNPDTGKTFCILPNLIPWYRGFTGTIEQDGKRFISRGTFTREKVGKKIIVTVTEIPIDKWIDDYKEYFEDLLEKKEIMAMQNFSTPNKPHFVITEGSTVCDEKFLKLYSYISISNLVLFDSYLKIKKYETVHHIIDDFCKVRLDAYVKRKRFLLDELDKKINLLHNKSKFVSGIINDTIVIFKKKEKDIIEDLTRQGFHLENGTFDYLLKMNILQFTEEKVRVLNEELKCTKEEREMINLKSEYDLWLSDIKELELKLI